MDLAPENIRVNAVSAGWTWFNIMDELSGGGRERQTRWPHPSICLAGQATLKRSRLPSSCSDDAVTLEFMASTIMQVELLWRSLGVLGEHRKPEFHSH